MNVGKLLSATAVVGIVVNVFDYVLHDTLRGVFHLGLADVLRQDVSVAAIVAGEFVAALVFVWVYDKVRGSFDAGMAGGAMFGLYAGILIAFPAFIFDHLLLAGFTYGLAWTWTLSGIAWGVLAGATAGMMYGNEGAGASDTGAFDSGAGASDSDAGASDSDAGASDSNAGASGGGGFTG